MEETEPVVLCVDDEARGLLVRKLILESQGYRVLTAESGPDGLAKFNSEPVDLVVLDYMMPDMTGDLVAKHMKRCRPEVPIVLLTAYVDLPGETLKLVDKHITKGEGPVILLKAIADLLSRPPRGFAATSEQIG